VGKAYMNKKKVEDHPIGDFYETPKSLVWKLIDTGELSGHYRIVEPCAGNGSIVDALMEDKRTEHIDIYAFDLFTGYESSFDIFDYNISEDLIVTNFPFNQWDAMVEHSLTFAKKVCTIGRVNYFGTHNRNKKELWKHLHNVWIFDRMIDYRGEIDPTGQFHVGGLVTAWFVFEVDYEGPIIANILDVQEYATLGAVKER
jgi:hypothetical protein